MHNSNAAGAVFLAYTLSFLQPLAAQAQQYDRQMQLCWSFGQFDQTVYFAETPALDDRKASFTEMLDISGINHMLVKCSYLGSQQRTVLLKEWSDARLETVNTTFLSDLDY